MRLGRPDAALGHLTDTLAALPGDVETLVELARCEAARGDDVAAAGRLRQVLDQRPDHPGALRALAEIPPPAVMPAEALACLEKAAALAPGDSELQAVLAMRLEGASRLDEAEAAAARAGGHPIADLACSQVAFRRGDAAAARAAAGNPAAAPRPARGHPHRRREPPGHGL
ncbi:MAG: tetratricopeptide repeat protein [Hyphomicrobiales bacterium]|nr:tetratricopeptide repeat protein [Hyphomicrobiales bacterium]